VTLADLPPLRDTLAAAGLSADKRFGQHFLLDLNICRKIARLAGDLDGQTVIEVGPGPGGLTRALLETGARVIAVERDPRFIPLLTEIAAAAACRLPKPLGKVCSLSVAWIRLPAESTTPSPRITNAPSIAENSLIVSSSRGSRTFRSPSG